MSVELKSVSAIILAAVCGFGIPKCIAQSAPESTASVACPQRVSEFERQRNTAVRLLKAGKAADALQALSSAYMLCPVDYQNAYDLAVAEVHTGENDKARSLIVELLQNQNRADLHTLLGRLYSSEKNHRAAAAQFQQAAELVQSEPNIFDFGTSLFKIDWGAAEKILRFGIEKYPTSVRLHVALGTALYGQSMPDEGAAILCKAAEIDGSDPHPMEILADTEVIPLTLLPKVVSLFASLRGRYPNDGTLLFDYTMARSGRWSGSKDVVPPGFVEAISNALLLNPRLPQAYYVLGLVNAEEEQYNSAITLFKKAIELKPDKDEYHYRLAFAYRKVGDESAAKEEIQLFRELHSRNSAP